MACNLGRIVSAAAPYTIGKLFETHGIGSALVLTSAGLLLAAFTASFLRGRGIHFADEPKWN